MAKLRLLVIAQAVDLQNPVLGFFHRWIEELAKYCEGQLTVICLEKGEHHLPESAKVLSLGKETGRSRFKYLWQFYKYIWQERKNYDAVLVHMNQEYVLLGWKLWWLLGKKIYLWRNHHAGNWSTDLVASFCTKVFCTSKFSYTAKYRKTVLMPVGIDTALFQPDPSVQKIPNYILFLARMSPVKKPDVLIEALKILKRENVNFIANFYGDAPPQDQAYYQSLKNNSSNQIAFHPGIPNRQTVKIYNAHEILVNLSSSGMYDKTIFEAAAAGALPLASNENLRGAIDERLLFKEGKIDDLVAKLKILLSLPASETTSLQHQVRDYVLSRHSLSLLGQKLAHELA